MSNRFADAGVPSGDAKIVIGYLTGDRTNSVSKVLESATWLQGYGLSFVPDTGLPVRAEALPEGELCTRLAESLQPIADHDPSRQGALGGGLIISLLPMILQLIQMLMHKN